MTPETNLVEAYQLMHTGILALSRMERQGIRLDREKAAAAEKELTEKIKQTTNELKSTTFYKEWKRYSGASININSDLQLGNFLYKIKKIKPTKATKTGRGATDNEALQSLAIPELDYILRIRKLRKMRDTYLAQFIREEVDGVIHPVFNLHTVQTYRSSSDSPNFQNIPVRDKEAKNLIRGLLFPRIGHQLLEVDFSGLEVCIAACYHKDPTMIKYIKDPTTDMHTDMAAQIFFFGKEFDRSIDPFKTLRGGAKNGFVFPQFYGDYYANNALALCKWAELPVKGSFKKTDGLELPDGSFLGAHLIANKVPTYDAFLEHLKKIEHHFWNKRFPVYDSWKKKAWAAYQKQGTFASHTGFEFTGLYNKKEVSNYPVQGSAFHCLLWALIQLDRIMLKRSWRTRLIGQIHDSLIFDVHPEELQEVITAVKNVTEVKLAKRWKWINVPLKIDAELCAVDASWSTKEEIKI
jgi:DNA polymerase-1